MDVCDIVFCSTNDEARAIIWAAIIGLAGGVLALTGAVMVGLRQTAIMHRQTDLQRAIADRAAEIEESKIRVELFSKRFVIFEATQKFVEHVHKTGWLPGKTPHLSQDWNNRDAAITLAFFEAIETSKILFRDGVHDDLQTIADAAESLDLHMGKAEEDGPSSEGHRAAAHDIKVRFAWLRYNLTELFDPDLQLGLRNGVPGKLNPDLTAA